MNFVPICFTDDTDDKLGDRNLMEEFSDISASSTEKTPTTSTTQGNNYIKRKHSVLIIEKKDFLHFHRNFPLKITKTTKAQINIAFQQCNAVFKKTFNKRTNYYYFNRECTYQSS